MKVLLCCAVDFTSFRAGRNRFPLHTKEAEDAGFDEHYFRRRPKSFCVPPPPTLPPLASAAAQSQPLPPFLPPGGAYGFVGGTRAEQAGIHLSMGSLLDEQFQRVTAAAGGQVVSARECTFACVPKCFAQIPVKNDPCLPESVHINAEQLQAGLLQVW